MSQTKDKLSHPEVKVEYSEVANEKKLSDVFRFFYDSDQLNIEFGQLKNYTDKEIGVTVVSKIAIPKQSVEFFLTGLVNLVSELVSDNQIQLKSIELKDDEIKAE